MSERPNLERLVTDWLRAEAPPHAPEAVLSTALARVVGVGQQRPLGGLWPDSLAGAAPRLRWALVLLALAALLASISGAGALLRRESHAPPPSGAPSNGWIAYSTDGALPGATDITTGSDIYLVREGTGPKLIAGRNGGKTRNVCPAFSPDGSILAFGSDTIGARVITLVAVDPDGATHVVGRINVPDASPPVCPRWSLDGSRLGYVVQQLGYVVQQTVVIRSLDGAIQVAAAGDPSLADFGLKHESDPPAVSPSGTWTARLGLVSVGSDSCRLTFTNVATTATHSFTPAYCGYAIAAWSPDGQDVLVMQDVSGLDFTMHQVAIDSGADSIVVSTVRTNGSRSWPGWGDVSWQPVWR